MDPEELESIIEKHKRFLDGYKDGVKADFAGTVNSKHGTYGIYGIQFDDVDFHECNWEHIFIQGCSLKGCDFSNSFLNRVGVNGSNLTYCNFDNAHLIYVTADHILTDCSFKNTILRNCRFQGLYSSGNKFEKAVFENCNIPGGSLDYCKFIECSFDNVNLRGQQISKCTFQDCKMNKVQLNGCDTIDTVFPEVYEPGMTVFKNIDLREVDFRGADITHIEFENCIFPDDLWNMAGSFHK